MAQGINIGIPCTVARHDEIQEAAKAHDMPMTAYVRQSIMLRQHLDENGWTAESLATAQGFIGAGAWKD